jgi:hypothetical protein
VEVENRRSESWGKLFHSHVSLFTVGSVDADSTIVTMIATVDSSRPRSRLYVNGYHGLSSLTARDTPSLISTTESTESLTSIKSQDHWLKMV